MLNSDRKCGGDVRIFQRITDRIYNGDSLFIHTINSNDKFSHDKATAELGYRPRDLLVTLRDTVSWTRGELEGRSPA